MADSINYQLAKFVASSGKVSQIPESTCPEVSFVGRSNVGKSSIMNKLFGRKNLVKVSSTPGKTSNINFFEADDVHFVDLPGYGFARRSRNIEFRTSNRHMGCNTTILRNKAPDSFCKDPVIAGVCFRDH